MPTYFILLFARRGQKGPANLVAPKEEEVSWHLPHEGAGQAFVQASDSLAAQNLPGETKRAAATEIKLFLWIIHMFSTLLLSLLIAFV